jgi:hypothetical protein
MSADPWRPPAPPPPAPHRRTWALRRWLLIATAFVVVAAVGAYVLNTVFIVPKANRPSTIANMPEANLLLPDSHILGRYSAKPGYDGAMVTTIIGVNATKADVFAFYRQQLTARGWHGPDSSGYVSTDEWAKDHYRFQLEFLGRLGDRTYPGEANYTTTYRAAIRYDPTPAAPAATSP